MACGVPVVGTAAGGLPEVVEDGRHGFLRPVGDVDGMARRARWRCSTTRRAGSAFRPTAGGGPIEEFPTEALVARYRALYEETLAG